MSLLLVLQQHMRWLVACTLLLMCTQQHSSSNSGSSFTAVCAAEASADLPLFDMTLTTITGDAYPMAMLKDKKAILIVNVASECGYTHSNYKMLRQLHNDYSTEGLAILAFPCNQFGLQEPGTSEQILEFVKTKYDVDFPILAKTDVNGQDTHPIFSSLKILSGNALNIEWNFSKFLIAGPPGRRRVQRFSHGEPLESVAESVIAAVMEQVDEPAKAEL